MVSPKKSQQHHQLHPLATSTPSAASKAPATAGPTRSTRPRTATAASAEANLGVTATPTTTKPRKSVKYVFSKKKFYLDLKTRSVTSAKIRQLIEDIQSLGGTIEDFFSKEVTTVISDAPEWKLRNPTGAPDVVSPGTPCSLSAITNSPWSPATPVEDKKIARSRVDTILERARQQAKGTSDVIENAHKWGLKVWSLHKILAWLEAFKGQVGPLRRPTPAHSAVSEQNKRQAVTTNTHHTRSQSVDSAFDQQRDLVAPYIKFEVNNHQYKPVHQEFKRFPCLHVNGRSGTSPFYSPESARSKINKRLLLKEEHRDTTRRQAKRHLSPQSKETKSKKLSGFCEICEVTYTDLDAHLETSTHKHVINLPTYWAKLDFCIGLVNMNSDDSVVEHSDGRS